jgi:hypothetical protein
MWPNLLVDAYVPSFITECLRDLIYYWMLMWPNLLVNAYVT